jgi:hypothetical protein
MIAANLLAGSVPGAWLGASWATRLRSQTLYRVMAGLLVAIALVLLLGHGVQTEAGIRTCRGLRGPPTPWAPNTSRRLSSTGGSKVDSATSRTVDGVGGA